MDVFKNNYDSWAKYKGCEDVQKKIDDIIKKFDPKNPAASLKDLGNLYSLLRNVDNKSDAIYEKMQDLTK